MKYDHAKPLIERLMHVAVLYHMSPGMLRTKIFDALKEFIPDMDDGCFERGCPAIDHFSSHTTTQDDEFKEMVKKGTKAWADTPDDWVDELRGGEEPVAWMCEANVFGSGGWKRSLCFVRNDNECFRNWQPLYAKPKSCTKVGTNSGVLHTKGEEHMTKEEAWLVWIRATKTSSLPVETDFDIIKRTSWWAAFEAGWDAAAVNLNGWDDAYMMGVQAGKEIQKANC